MCITIEAIFASYYTLFYMSNSVQKYLCKVHSIIVHSIIECTYLYYNIIPNMYNVHYLILKVVMYTNYV